MGIKDFWRKHKNKKIAKKDEKLLKRLQELNIDPDDLLQRIERPENADQRQESTILMRVDDLEKRLEDIQKRNEQDFEKDPESDHLELPGPSMNPMESRKSRIQPVQINNYYLLPNELNANQQSLSQSAEEIAEIEVQRKRNQEKEDEEFARRLQLELEEEEFFTFRRQRVEEPTGLETIEDEEKMAKRRQIDKDADFAWNLHFQETRNEALEKNDSESNDRVSTSAISTRFAASTSQREEIRAENNPAEVPEFIRRATEIQQRLAGNSTRNGYLGAGSSKASTVRQDVSTVRPDGNSSSADTRVYVNEEEIKAINEQIENDAALARALADAENEFFERHHLGTRNRHSTGNNEQLERFTELVPMLLSDLELNESDDEEKNENFDEIDRERSSDDHCVICLEDEIVDAVACAKCRQLLGCRRCVLNWYRGGTGDDFSTALWFVVAGDQNYKSCPLCRVRWGNQPELINLKNRLP